MSKQKKTNEEKEIPQVPTSNMHIAHQRAIQKHKTVSLNRDRRRLYCGLVISVRYGAGQSFQLKGCVRLSSSKMISDSEDTRKKCRDYIRVLFVAFTKPHVIH